MQFSPLIKNRNGKPLIIRLIKASVLLVVTIYVANIFAYMPSSEFDNLQLLGSISNNNSGVALVKHRTKSEVKAFKIGEIVFGVGKLISVAREMMVIRTVEGAMYTVSSKLGGNRKLLAPGNSKGRADDDRYYEDGFERVGNKIEVDARYRDKMIKEDLPKVLMEAASEPIMVNGGIVGFRLFEIDENSMFRKLGIKEGDIVSEINGVPLNDVPRTIQLLNSLRKEPHIVVNVTRGGAPVSLDMNVR